MIYSLPKPLKLIVMGLWGIDMQVTDKMIKAALEAWFGEPVTEPYEEHVDNMRFAIQAAIQAAWVSVDDSLPPLNEMVLAYRPNAHLSNDPHYKITFITDREQTSPTNVTHKWDCWCEVSHWMPLPEFKGR